MLTKNTVKEKPYLDILRQKVKESCYYFNEKLHTGISRIVGFKVQSANHYTMRSWLDAFEKQFCAFEQCRLKIKTAGPWRPAFWTVLNYWHLRNIQIVPGLINGRDVILLNIAAGS